MSHLMIIPREIQLEIATFVAPPNDPNSIYSLSCLARTSKYWRALIDLKSPRFITPRELASRLQQQRNEDPKVLKILDVVGGYEHYYFDGIEHYVTSRTIARYCINNPNFRWEHVTRNKCITIDVLKNIVKKHEVPADTQFLLNEYSSVTCAELRAAGLKVDVKNSLCGLVIEDIDDYILAYVEGDDEPEAAVKRGYGWFVSSAKLDHKFITSTIYSQHIASEVHKLLYNENFSVEFLEQHVFTSSPLTIHTTEGAIERLKRQSKKWREHQLYFIKLINETKDQSLRKNMQEILGRRADADILLNNSDLMEAASRVIAMRTDLPMDFIARPISYWSELTCVIQLRAPPTDQELKFMKMYDNGELTVEIMHENKHIVWNWYYYFSNSKLPISTIMQLAPKYLWDNAIGTIFDHPDFTIDEFLKYFDDHVPSSYAYLRKFVRMQ